MNEKDHNDFVLVDAIVSEAYLQLMVSCLFCDRALLAEELAIAEPKDPMDKWAEEYSAAAKEAGWVVSQTGSILCPNCK